MISSFVPLVSAAGLLVVGHCISVIVRDPVNPQWLILAALTLLTGSFTLKIPSIPVRISVSATFVFASVILFGTCAGTLTVALEVLVAVATGSARTPDPLRVIFNVSSATLSIWFAGELFYFLAGARPFSGHQIELRVLLVPLIALAATYFLLNSSLVATAIALNRRQSIFAIWRNNFLPLSLNYVGGASLAALLVSYTNTVDLITLAIIIPLLVISYLTFKYSVGRVEDANRHIAEVNGLYIRTVEALAIAIDAKDQVTHGHIRRVQKFALGLSARLGVTDEAQLKAIEAAALLHDTGKLVVPEHILNKPGKLSSGEFAKMKRHASAGAEILSSIAFPYPVVPIVRHHHENWDGTGYPDGLKGTSIPIGARILAVVDCFDALTSDRPYRAKLSDDEAIQILFERRGVMYDPLIVDVFVSAKDELARACEFDNDFSLASRDVYHHVGDIERASVALDQPSNNHEVVQVTQLLTRSLLNATNALISTIYLRDLSNDELRVAAVSSALELHQFIAVIPVGSRVTGWVAANGTPIVNADAALDLPDYSQRYRLRKCLCVPISDSLGCFGVVSLYSNDDRGFSQEDVLLVESTIRSVDLTILKDFLTAEDLRRSSTPRSPTVH